MKKKNILVLGMKTFGKSIVKELYRYDCDVLAIDKDQEAIEEIAEYTTEAVQLDIRDTREVKNLSLNLFDIAIVTVDDIESSIMASLILKEAEIPEVIVKASGRVHRKILEKMGIEHIISPEEETGKKLAQNIMDLSIIDMIRFSDEHSIVEIKPFDKWAKKSLKRIDPRGNYGMNILCVKKEDGSIYISPASDYMVEKTDIFIVVAENERLRDMGALEEQ